MQSRAPLCQCLTLPLFLVLYVSDGNPQKKSVSENPIVLGSWGCLRKVEWGLAAVVALFSEFQHFWPKKSFELLRF
jgi:hypothetical protein